MTLPDNPDRYLPRLGNHKKIIAALAEAKSRRDYNPYTAADLLRRFPLMLTDADYREDFFDAIERDDLVSLLQSPPPTAALFELLYQKRLLPTPVVLAHAKRGKEAVESLDERVSAIAAGNFDIQNQVDIELEYATYILRGPPSARIIRDFSAQIRTPTGSNLSFDRFKVLPWLEGKQVILDRFDEEDAMHTAREAIAVFEQIKAKQREWQAPVLVIGNQRYGGSFVIEPIEEYLAAAGIHVVYERLASIDFDGERKRTNVGHISGSTWAWIAENNPHVIVVDGTNNPKKEGWTRFPAAMRGYINAFATYNAAAGATIQNFYTGLGDQTLLGFVDQALLAGLQRLKPTSRYKVSFWAPDCTPKVCIDDAMYEFTESGDENRELLLISSTAQGHGYSGAMFDDPENNCEDCHLGFTYKGLAYLQTSTSVPAYVKAIQAMMRETIQATLGSLHGTTT